MDALYELLEDVQSRLGYPVNTDDDSNSEWDAKIEYIEDLINKVHNSYSKESLRSRYVRLLYNAKKVPTDRAISYNVFKQMLKDLCDTTVECEVKAREELLMPENFGFEVPHEGQTEEERQKLRDEKKAKVTDWLKKNKKKPKTEDEDAKDMEELKNRVSVALSQQLVENRVERAENDVELVRTQWLMDNHLVMDSAQYDGL
jgi:hypothetical protein